MLTLNDGRSELWQWDTKRKLTVDAECSQVHFSNKVFGRSIDVDVLNGLATIPDILLQTDKELTAWAFVGTAENGYTKISKVFKVNKRNKPADYVFTPPEQTSLEEIKEKIEYLESIQDPDAIKNAVEDYLEQNPPAAYTLPTATETTLGGVKAAAATEEMTQPVCITEDGKLVTAPGQNSGGNSVLCVTVRKNHNGITTVSHTNSEIEEAYGKGMEIICHYSDMDMSQSLQLVHCMTHQCTFTALSVLGDHRVEWKVIIERNVPAVEMNVVEYVDPETFAGFAEVVDKRFTEFAETTEEAFNHFDDTMVKSVNGQTPDENGNVKITIQDSGGNVDYVGVEPAEDDMPKVFFGGALQQTKDEKVVPFRYISKTDDFSGYAEIKAQGNSSMNYPKKNQTVKMFADEACDSKMKKDFKGWGKQNKHVYKANWIDLTHARNVVSARLWADVVKSRANYAELPELLRTSPNQGAVDGFPVKVYADGVYQGRYTLNIPKDKWTFNMDDELDEHCVLCGENYYSGCFRAAAKIDESDWTDEIHDVVPASIKTRWNQVISFVMNSTDEEFKANLSQYFYVDSLIDYYLFGLASCGLDAFGKNQIYATYDGQKWIASMYDMDSTWGLYWNGSKFVASDYARTSYEDYVSTSASGEGNLLYNRLEQLFSAELQTRWEELKNGALSIENIINRFERFTDIAPAELVKEDYASTTGGGKFTGIPSQTTNNIQQIRAFALTRQAWTDEYISALNGESGEEEPDEPVAPEVTLTSISATYSGGTVSAGTAVTALTGIAVTAHYSDGSTENVTGYTLSGTIAEGSNTITVSYGGKTTTFTVTGVSTVIDYGIDYTLDSLNGISWNANSDINKTTGVLTTKTNHYVTDRFSLQKACYVIPKSTVYTYTIIIAWDAAGNFIGCYGDQTQEYAFTADPDWQYALRVYSEDGSEPNIVLTPVDNRTTMVATVEIDLASLEWATGKRGAEANVESKLAEYCVSINKNTVHHANYFVQLHDAYDGMKYAANELNFGFQLFVGKYLHCINLRTAEEAIAYFTENNTKLILNG